MPRRIGRVTDALRATRDRDTGNIVADNHEKVSGKTLGQPMRPKRVKTPKKTRVD